MLKNVLSELNVKPIRVIIDVDDVLYPLNELVCKQLQLEEIKVRYNDIADFKLSNFEADIRARMLELYADTAILESSKPYPGALETLEHLTSMGCEIIIATNPTLAFAERRKEKLIADFGSIIRPANIMFGGRKDLLQADFIVDDSVDNLMASVAERKILVTRPWNQTAGNLIRINDITDLPQTIKEFFV